MTPPRLARLALAAGLLCAACAPPPDPAPPNLVLLLADDLGWGDVGFHGSAIETPSIDALAAGGVELSQFYVMPVCSPTRAALLTGRYPMRYGMQQGATHLPLSERTLAERLRAVGYRTALVGKWHLGWRHPAYLPTKRGFDHQYGLYTGATDYFERTFAGSDEPNWFRDDQPLLEEGYATDLIADEAVRLIRDHDPRRPLFLWVSFNAPHTPLSVPERYAERYPDLEPGPRLYAQVVSCMDDAIGRVVGALEDRGLLENTLIVFTSDNGPSTRAPSSAGLLQGHKHLLYEGGVRVPALLHWSGVLPEGGRYEAPLHAVDLYATLLSLGGVAAEREGGELLYNVDIDRTRASAIRSGDWKLIQRRKRSELYDLARDPYETQDLAAEREGVRRRLEARLEAYRLQAVEAMPGGRPHLPKIDAELRARWSDTAAP